MMETWLQHTGEEQEVNVVKRWGALEILDAEHRRGEEMLRSLELAAANLREGRQPEALELFERSLKFFDEDLRLHFDHEERALFPVLGRLIGRAGPIGAMVAEHESFWNCLDELSEEIDGLKVDAPDPQDLAEVERLANHVVWLLRGHILREDTMLFPLADRTLDERGKQEVLHNMRVVDRLESR